ncbi:MAG: hypothetical protein M9908_05070 [Phyllobacteriaceae bacterium]|nr:hypothetical protein [Phyllobacteriaceae bacterium]
MAKPDFDCCVFINCPFDEDYAPILQAILFCVTYLGFQPRLALEAMDSGQSRLDKIQSLIGASRYSIHDLSRCQSTEVGEHFRMNMPFELGIDQGCRRYGGKKFERKKFLILEEQKYRYQAAISDLSGCDIEFHAGHFDKAILKVRNWLVNEAGAKPEGPARIQQAYTNFQEWYYERQLASGASDEDIQHYPTKEMLTAMIEWNAAGRPVSFN